MKNWRAYIYGQQKLFALFLDVHTCASWHFIHKKFWSNNIHLIWNAVWRKTFWHPHTDKNVRKCQLQRNTGKIFRQNPKCRLRRNKSTTFWHKSDDCILAAAPSNSLLLCLANFDLNMEIFWGLTPYNLFPKSYFLWNFFLQHAEYILEFLSKSEKKRPFSDHNE